MIGTVPLSNGLIAQVDSLHIWQTYEGVLEFQPTDAHRQRMIQKATVKAERLLKPAPLYVMPLPTPLISFRPVLPPWCYALVLNCSEPIDDSGDASWLGVLHIGPDLESTDLKTFIAGLVADLDWNTLAKTYEF